MEGEGRHRSKLGPSLAGKLGKVISLSVSLTILVVLAAFCLLTYRIQVDERRNNLQAVAATAGRLIERPMSLGDYALVEAYLSANNLPAFVEAFAVKGSDGSLLAGHEFKAAKDGVDACRFSETATISIGKTSALINQASVLTMRAGFCDIRSNAIGLGIGAVGVAISLFLIISIMSRLAVKRALRPLTQSVAAAASQAELSSDLLVTAPEEIRPLLLKLDQIYCDYLKVEASARVGELAEQIAHDIRSPLTSLRSMANQAAALPPDQKQTLLSVIDRITDIANGLLRTKRHSTLTETAQDGATNEVYLVNDVIESLISEKRAQYRPRSDIKIEAALAEGTAAVFSDADRGKFQTVLSNLIDNAFEAIQGAGSIVVRLGVPSASRYSVEVQDNGIGIPDEYHGRLGTRGFTFGKDGGSGLGLSSAKRFAEASGGSLEVISAPNAGTRVIVLLPIAHPPEWFLPKLIPSRETTIVVIDDDDSIHAAWRQRFRRAGFPADGIVHVYGKADLERLLAGRGAEEEMLFLVDLDLGQGSEDGLTLAKAIPPRATTVLVSSHYDSSEVRAKAAAVGMKVLPKQFVPFVPIEVVGGSLDCVLIDDDVMVQMVWQSSAKTFGKRIRIFSEPPRDSELRSVPQDTMFYVDQNLRHGVRGTEVSKSLFEKGYRNLVLASGSNSVQRRAVPWIRKTTVDKCPPWETELEFKSGVD